MKKITSWNSFVHSCVHEFRKGSKRKKEKKNVLKIQCSLQVVESKVLLLSDVISDVTTCKLGE